MSFNGTGTFVINSSGQPVVSGTVISATVFNALTADLATGLSTCLTKDGQTTPTNNIPMGGFKITGLGAGTVGTDAVRLSQVQAMTAQLLSASGTDTITALATPTLTAYTAGNLFYFVAAATNTTSVTLNVDGLGAKAVTRHGSTALVAGDILAGEVCLVVYDGTRFQLLNPASYTNLNVTGNLTLNGGTANGVAYLNGSKALTTGSALVFDGTNLGVGTASPAAKLHLLNSTPSSGKPTILADANYGATGDTTTGLRLNLNSGAGGGYLSGYSTEIIVGHNNEFISGSGWVARATTASQLRQASGAFEFLSNTGLTAGSAFTPTVRMTLDSSGNLGIGTSSPTRNLQVSSATTTYVSVVNTGASPSALVIGADPSQTTLYSWTTNSGSTGVPLAFYTSASESMRLDTSGNLGIGTSSPGTRLDVDGGAQDEMARINSTGNTSFAVYRSGVRQVYLQSDASNINLWGEANKPLRFATNNVERARITANGSFVAGASAALATTATNGFLYVPTCAGTPTGTPTAITGMAPIVVDTTNNKLYFYSGGAWRDAGP